MSERRLLFVLVIVAAVVRFAWLLAIPTIQVSDAGMYEELGWRLAESGRFEDSAGRPEVFWPVGYPLLLAGLFRLFGTSHWTYQIVNLVAGTILCVLVYRLAKRSFSPGVAAASGFVTALFPSLVASTSLCLPQGLLATALVALALGWRQVIARGPACFALGVATGLAALAKGTYLVVPFVFLAFDAVRRRIRIALLVRPAAIVLAGIALVVLPWTARNVQRFGRPVLLSANWGHVLWMGYNPLATGAYYFPDDPDLNPLVREADPIRRDALGRDLAFRFIREHPEALPRLVVKKIWRHLRDDVLAYGLATRELARPLAQRPLRLMRWGTQLYYMLVLLGAIGYGLRALARWTRTRRSALSDADFWLAVVLFWNLSQAVLFHGSTKYHYVLVPFLVPVAVRFWWGLVLRERGVE